MTVYDLLEHDEGVQPHVYFLNGIPHFGIGHNGLGGPPLTLPAMRFILKDDVAALTRTIHQDVSGWGKLNDVRQAVLISIAFQVGYTGFLAFVHLLQAVAMGDYAGAAREIRNSQLAHQNVERTARLAAMMESGNWTPPSGGSR